MLFNSYDFIFLFFPIVLGTYFFLGRWEEHNWANAWLVFASLCFYGYWDYSYVPLLCISIITNYLISGGILWSRDKDADRLKKIFWTAGLVFNIGLLGYYKYFDFFLENLNWLGTDFELLHIVLPLGISFFTITQLLYLLDCYKGVTKEHDFLNYALFVSFFPHLLAGPILYHRQMLKQFKDVSRRHVNWENMSAGMTLFVIGLMKKVLIADALSPYVGEGYANVEALTLFSAWLTAISYMLQLYFDFSGYSDMAVGMARMMNLHIPINFNSPYRATSLINYWQRWHISLTNAITGCIYIPTVQSFSRPTVFHNAFAAFVTFFIVGVWHGAGWTYVLVGVMNGVGIAINYVWKQYHLWMPDFLGRVLTLMFALVMLVFFRADSVWQGVEIVEIMLGRNGIEWPQKVVDFAGQILGVLIPVGNVPGTLPKVIFIVAILIVAFSPNSNQLVKCLSPSNRWCAIIVAAGLWYAVLQLGSITEFLYFQF